jgi:hypothetical protein
MQIGAGTACAQRETLKRLSTSDRRKMHVASKRWSRSNVTRIFVIAVALLAFARTAHATLSDPPVIIRQVCGGGGNSGAVYKQDFAELFNRSSAAVSLAGWSIPYTPVRDINLVAPAVTRLCAEPIG